MDIFLWPEDCIATLMVCANRSQGRTEPVERCWLIPARNWRFRVISDLRSMP